MITLHTQKKIITASEIIHTSCLYENKTIKPNICKSAFIYSLTPLQIECVRVCKISYCKFYANS